MNHKVCAVVFAFLLLSLGSVTAQPVKINIAVNDLTGQGIDQAATAILSDRLRAELINTGVFRVMERAEMESILKEQGFQRTGACDETCIVQTGQLLGVDRMVAGSIGAIGGFYTISLRMLNVATGEILYTVSDDFEGAMKDLISSGISRVANKLAFYGKSDATKQAFAGRSGDLYISADQPGATVEIDGKPMSGETPITLQGIEAGEHQVVARKAALYASQKITLEPGDLLKVSLTLREGKATLKVFSDPDGAQISLDGKSQGSAPLKIEGIGQGEHTIVATKYGYVKAEKVVNITSEELQTISFSLKMATWLSVDVQPATASILINDAAIGTGSLTRYELPAGKVTLQIEAPGYEVYREELDLQPGATQTVSKKLISKFAQLDVRTIPSGAKVYLNEQPVGSSPYHNDKVQPGNYMLRIDLASYEPIRTNLTLPQNETVTKEYTLEHTKAWKDSTAAAKDARYRKIRWVRRIGFGSLAIGLGAAGIYFNDRANYYYDTYKHLQWDTSTNATPDYDSYWQWTEKSRNRRNAAYILSGLCATGFAISIRF
jgi:hypothetical protein